MAEEKGTLSIVFDERDDRPHIPVSGAVGGPAPNGSMVYAHVYTEFATIPAMEDHSVEEGGRVDLSKGHQIRRGDITRTVLATLVLSPESAIAVGQWLVRNGNGAKKVRDGKDE